MRMEDSEFDENENFDTSTNDSINSDNCEMFDFEQDSVNSSKSYEENEEIEVGENLNNDSDTTEEIDPKYLDKNGNKLSDKAIAKIRAKEARKEQKKRQAELEKKISEANKIENEQKELEEEEARLKEKEALKSNKRAIKLAHKRIGNTKYAERFEVNIEDGLNDEQVNQRILEGFSNFKPKNSSKTYGQIFFTNIFTVLNILLFVIAGFLISVGSIKDLSFLVMISLNIIIGIIQEIRAKKQIDKLSLITSPTVKVLRNGKISEISTGEVVLDDIMILTSGKQICADSVVVSDTIEVNESMLTGESDAILKKPGDTLYSGSIVVAGNCKAKVEKVGKDNYIESLTTSAKKYVKPKSELLHSLNLIIYVMSFLVVVLGGLLFYVQYVKNGMNYVESIRKTAGAMIGMIPSGLYLCTSMALAVGVMRLARNGVLVQELYCIEMLARINVLCLDKTGTITDGTMKVKNVIEYKNFGGINTRYAMSALLNALNDDNLTSVAMKNYFGLQKRLKVLGTIPFSSKRKLSAASFDKYGTYIMGAPEFVLSKETYETISKDVDKFAREGFRVLLLAYTEGLICENTLPDTEILPMSLILIEDNIRPDAIETINYFKNSGVEVKVISGDNPTTVSMIAKRAGIENADNFISLDGMSEQDVVRAASKFTVFGRVSPNQKRLLVKTLKEEGKTVAMTGDGVNDLLALKEADCSIAMASGSDAARNVSHLVLIDSNFACMPNVVAEGRRVINNVTKVSRLYLTKTMFSLLLAILALIQGYYPISTNQLFIIDLFVIGIPSVILVLEKNNDLNKGHFLANVIKSALPGAIVIVILSLIVFILKDEFSMTTTISSTLIVLSATFTCMMVLYDVCLKPVFTTIHKVLFYSMFACFIFLTLITPKFFDFAPIFSVGTYYSDTLEVVKWEAPTVAISDQNTYAVDGYVITKSNKSGDESYYYAATKKSGNTASVNEYGELVLDNTNIINLSDYTPKIPALYKTSDDKYGLGGYVTNLVYDESKSVTVERNGQILYSGIDTGYNVLPTVSISSDGSFLINNEIIADNKSKVSTITSVEIDSDYNIVVNGEIISSLYNKQPITYGRNRNNYLVLNLENTDLEFNSYDADVTIKTTYYYIDGVQSKALYKPSITVTEKDYYIVNGYLTDKNCNGNNDLRSLSYSKIDGKYYLTINGQVIDYEVNVYTTTGGTVQALPIQCIILLFMLCLLSAPLMKIVTNIVPFTKKWIRIFADKINQI